MYDSPGSLQDVCVDFICENIETICEGYYLNPTIVRFESFSDDSLYEEHNHKGSVTSNGIRLIFKGSEIFLHTVIAEQLLVALCTKKKLCDPTMTLFDVSTTRLRYVRSNTERVLYKNAKPRLINC